VIDSQTDESASECKKKHTVKKKLSDSNIHYKKIVWCMAVTFSHQTARDTREENIPKNREANGTSQMLLLQFTL